METHLFCATVGAAIQELRRASYKGLYLGNEFCRHLLPSAQEIKDAGSLCAEKDIPLTLVTPYGTAETMRACGNRGKRACPWYGSGHQ